MSLLTLLQQNLPASISGTVAISSQHVTLAVTDQETFSGSAAEVSQHATVAATGQETFSGTAAVASQIGVAGTGAETFSGSAAESTQHPALAAVGSESFAGSGSATAQKDALAGTGGEAFAAHGAEVAVHPSFVGAGTYVPLPITGSGGVVAAEAAIAGTGSGGVIANSFAGGGKAVSSRRMGLQAVAARANVSGQAGLAVGTAALVASGSVVAAAAFTLDELEVLRSLVDEDVFAALQAA